MERFGFTVWYEHPNWLKIQFINPLSKIALKGLVPKVSSKSKFEKFSDTILEVFWEVLGKFLELFLKTVIKQVLRFCPIVSKVNFKKIITIKKVYVWLKGMKQFLNCESDISHIFV